MAETENKEKTKENTTLNMSGTEVKNQPIDIPNNKKIDTYIGLKNEDSLFEIDLSTARQKGQEIRYLSISFEGINIMNGEQQNAFMNLDENNFVLLKKFFSQLEWNS